MRDLTKVYDKTLLIIITSDSKMGLISIFMGFISILIKNETIEESE